MISERLRHLRQQARSVADWLESTWRSVPESLSLTAWQSGRPPNTWSTRTGAGSAPTAAQAAGTARSRGRMNMVSTGAPPCTGPRTSTTLASRSGRLTTLTTCATTPLSALAGTGALTGRVSTRRTWLKPLTRPTFYEAAGQPRRLRPVRFARSAAALSTSTPIAGGVSGARAMSNAAAVRAGRLQAPPNWALAVAAAR